MHDASESYRFPVPEIAKLSGLSLAGKVTYSQAVTEFAGMSHFHDGVIYRTVGIDFSEDSKTIEFSRGYYFEHLDTNEVLAYSAVARTNRRYRARLKDPFDLRNRVAGLGILTLTVYEKKPGEFAFLMHKRSDKVVIGAGMFHPVPAGEFTPSDVSLESFERDFDLRRNIDREFAEELLGDPDAQGAGGFQIDYVNARPYKELRESMKAGDLSYHCLGIGMDPFTWKLELLTIAIFRSDSFQWVFGDGKLPGNLEGTIIQDNRFNEKVIDQYVHSGSIRLGAVTTLRLAWMHRGLLRIG